LAEIPQTFSRLLPTMKEVYGSAVHSPNRADINLYRRYAGMASSCKLEHPSGKQQINTYKRVILAQQSAFAVDNTLQVTTPFVPNSSMDVYLTYVYKNKGPLAPSVKDRGLYHRYATLGVAK